MKFLKLQSWPILQQLRLEEALLRLDHQEWCIINQGAAVSVVMGISGKPAKLLDLQKLKELRLPVIKRFSGGGTVVVDPNTILVSFIRQEDRASPSHIMEWSSKIYQPFFKKGDFRACQRDYVFGNRKFGGNAQYITKNRWVHHTSFLWDYDRQLMEVLKQPIIAPEYRRGRYHHDFLCTLKEFYGDKERFLENLESYLVGSLALEPAYEEEAIAITFQPCRISTCLCCPPP
ncbi:MAG: lipoyl protein ligase domain-containing protein [Chlamydiota bacterium]